MNGATALALSLAVSVIAWLSELHPFAMATHTWQFAAFAALAALVLLAAAAAQSSRRSERARLFIGLACAGGAFLAALCAHAAYAIGPPQRIIAVPGRLYRAPHSARVSVLFPSLQQRRFADGRLPTSVTIVEGSARRTLQENSSARAGPYVFSVSAGPLAYVSAWSPSNKPVTITRPDSSNFLSPFLSFESFGAQPEDTFAVPALHRSVRVNYYAGLPSRGIDIPFVLFEISEENGGVLYRGVAVSGRTVRKAGVRLRFLLGSYPIVVMGSAPAPTPFVAGIALVTLGAAGYLGASLTAMRASAPRV